jgi:hypothetical protein
VAIDMKNEVRIAREGAVIALEGIRTAHTAACGRQPILALLIRDQIKRTVEVVNALSEIEGLLP